VFLPTESSQDYPSHTNNSQDYLLHNFNMARTPPTSGGAANGTIVDLMRTIFDNEIHLSNTMVSMAEALNHSMSSQVKIAKAVRDSAGHQVKYAARMVTLETKANILLTILVLWVLFKVVLFTGKAMAALAKGNRRQIQQNGVAVD
jgi:hypothetical protein